MIALMKFFLRSPLILATALSLTLPLCASAQNTIATANEAQISSGTPSTFQIRRNILLQQQAAVENQIVVASQCIANASRPQTLRDPQGNVNQVPLTDVVNCSRQLRALERRLTSILRQFQQLSADATMAAGRFQTVQEIAQRRVRTRWVTGQ